MKILSMLASPAAGGAEMLVRNLSAEFVARGHAARILFMSSAEDVGNPAAFEKSFLAWLDQAGAGWEIMTPAGFRNLFSGARQLRRAVRAFRPDILHIHLARGLMCRSLSFVGVPTIYTHHNVTTNFSPHLFRLFDLSVDRYVAIGSACRALLEVHVRRPIVSAPNGVPASFSSDGRRGPPGRQPFILAVGNLTPQKDYPNLIAAAAIVVEQLAAEGREARFAIAGEGPERPKLEALLAERKLGERFELLGARSDVADLMRDADLLVNSSAHEGLPVTLIEGAMSGLPTVATDVGGNSEVVVDGVNGYVVPPGQPEQLAGAVMHILADPAVHRAFSRAAIEQGGRFTLDACADAHLDLYRTVASAPRPGFRDPQSGSITER